MLREDIRLLYDQEDLYEYAAGVTDIYAYIADCYSLGTCTKEFHNGEQTDSFHALISRESPAGRQEDVSSVYARYLINDSVTELVLIRDEGRKLAFQKDNTAMVLYSPKTRERNIRSMKLAVMINDQFGAVKEIRNTAGPLAEGDEFPAASPVFIRFDKVFCMIYPLTAGTDAFVKIERIFEALSVSIYNYRGESRYFARKRLKLTPAGFVFEIRNAMECEGFDGFIGEMSSAEASDRCYSNHHTRFAFDRIVKYRRGERVLECSYSPVSEGIRYIRADGKLLTPR